MMGKNAVMGQPPGRGLIYSVESGIANSPLHTIHRLSIQETVNPSLPSPHCTQALGRRAVLRSERKRYCLCLSRVSHPSHSSLVNLSSGSEVSFGSFVFTTLRTKEVPWSSICTWQSDKLYKHKHIRRLSPNNNWSPY